MASHPYKLATTVATLLLAALAGCGGDSEPGLLPEERAATLQALLDEAEQRFDDGKCDRIEPTLERLDAEVDGLPDAEVDGRLRRVLNAEVVELGELSERCRDAPEEAAPVPPPADEVAPPPAEPETTEDEETKDEETKDEEKPPKPEPPPKPDTPEKPAKPEPAPDPPPEQEPPADPCANDSPRC